MVNDRNRLEQLNYIFLYCYALSTYTSQTHVANSLKTYNILKQGMQDSLLPYYGSHYFFPLNTGNVRISTHGQWSKTIVLLTSQSASHFPPSLVLSMASFHCLLLPFVLSTHSFCQASQFAFLTIKSKPIYSIPIVFSGQETFKNGLPFPDCTQQPQIFLSGTQYKD